MDVGKGHVSVRRGTSWSPGGVRKPLQATQDMDAPSVECNASWENEGLKGQPTVLSSTNHIGRKTNLTRSASLSEKELKEARVRSQIIAAQLTIPSNSNSRGVQLFNRRKQRVNAFTLESHGEGSGKDRAENVKASPSSNKLTWAEKSSEDKDRELNCKNVATKALWSPTGRTQGGVGDIMEEPAEHFHTVDDLDDQVIQERHFQPVSEKEELEEEEEEEMMKARQEEEREEALRDLEDTVRDEISPESANGVPAGLVGVHAEPVPNGALLNGCYSSVGPEKVAVSISKPAAAIVNRTARPFFSPAPVQSPERVSPVMEVPPVTNYPTPPLPTFTAPRPVAFSPPPPPPSYPTPPLPAFTNQPPQGYSSPPPMSPVMSPASPPPLSQFPSAVSHMSHRSTPNPPAPHYGPPTAPRPSTFVPRPVEEKKPAMPIKTGILEEGAAGARRSNRKAMFTFKEKTVVSPNPELLSLVQGADERKKHGHRPVPEPVSEEELLALGAEASNFLAEEEKTEQATSPEWASSLKSSRTRARVEHKPEQSLTNASGKGAELFAKRQSRMEQFEVHKAGQMRSPSPTMSLPPSWVYQSNMPGRVKAIAKNSDVCAQLSQNLKAQQAVQRKPVKKAPPPPLVPEPPPLENGCTQIEMDLSRHQPYQLNSSLFILNPVKDPMNSLPRGAPPPKPLVSSQSYSRQASLPSSPGQFGSFASYRPAQCMSPPPPLSPIGRMDSPTCYGSASALGLHRITSPVSAFSPERVASPRSGVQAPRPTFSAKRAGIEPQQMKKELSPTATANQTPTPTRTPSLTRRFSTPEGPTPGTWSPSPQSNQPPSKPSVASPLSPPWGSRCQSPMVSQTTQPSAVSSKTFTTASPVSPPWGSRCQSPMVCQTNQPFSPTKPLYTSTAASPVSPARESRCMSPIVSNLNSKANHRLLAKNIINAAKRKNSPSPGALSGHGLPISPLGSSHHGYDCTKPSISPFQSRALGAQSPTFTSPPPTPTQRICSPVRLYNTRSLTDSDASVESEDSGLRSPGGLRTYNTCPRGWGGSLRVKRGSVSTDL